MAKLHFVSKSALAAILISLGVAVSLTLGNALGAVLFAFGLLSVCVLQANLYTGKAGYWWRNQFSNLCLVLLINLVVGYAMGFIISIAFPSLVIAAQIKVLSWTFSLSHFIQAVFCGMVMYIAVELYKRKEPFGIFLGIPLFILAGFQHCIANAIVLGVAHTISATLILSIPGNLLGSMIINILEGKLDE